jgi:hypothetical protein
MRLRTVDLGFAALDRASEHIGCVFELTVSDEQVPEIRGDAVALGCALVGGGGTCEITALFEQCAELERARRIAALIRGPASVLVGGEITVLHVSDPDANAGSAPLAGVRMNQA